MPRVATVLTLRYVLKSRLYALLEKEFGADYKVTVSYLLYPISSHLADFDSYVR